MTSKINSSPNWKRPSEIMKMHRRKKRLSLPNNLKNVANDTKPVFHDITNNRTGTKRRNPFVNEEELPASKRSNTELSDADQSNTPSPCNGDEPTLFKLLDEGDMSKAQSQIKAKVDMGTEDVNNDVFQDLCKNQANDNFKQDEQLKTSEVSSVSKDITKQGSSENVFKNSETFSKRSDTVPVDWSLKVKLRIVSQTSLTWTSQLKTQEESQGVSNFVKQKKDPQVGSLSSQKSDFQSSLMYWVYPNLPWFRNFPRIISDNKGSKLPAILMNDEIQAALQTDWSESFTSAFHQLRSQQCPYFYLCTHQFTVLFCCPGIGGYPGLHAFLTPTTRGLRQSLKTEDIEFSMPLLDFRRASTAIEPSVSNEPQDNPSPQLVTSTDTGEDRADDFLDTDEGASVWLEELGLDKKSFPSLDPNRVKLQREGFRVIDNRPESLVFVEGGEVQALFNFLLNCRGCTATSGPQAGVPPTILAPRAFKGATLRSNKFKHSVAKQSDDSGRIKQSHVVEISGPILPQQVHDLCRLLRQTQPDFSMSFNNHDQTTPFNVNLLSKCEDECSSAPEVQTVLENCDNFYMKHTLSDTLASIRELNCTEEGVFWQT